MSIGGIPMSRAARRDFWCPVVSEQVQIRLRRASGEINDLELLQNFWAGLLLPRHLLNAKDVPLSNGPRRKISLFASRRSTPECRA